MQRPAASLGKRLVALAIDGIIVFMLLLIPVVGYVLALAYMLTRDGLIFTVTKSEQWRNRSIGKKMMGLEVATLYSVHVDIMTSIKRNIIRPLGLVDWMSIFRDNTGERLGDKITNTRVVESGRWERPRGSGRDRTDRHP